MVLLKDLENTTQGPPHSPMLTHSRVFSLESFFFLVSSRAIVAGHSPAQEASCGGSWKREGEKRNEMKGKIQNMFFRKS